MCGGESVSGNTHSIGYYRSAPLVVQYLGPTAGGRGARLLVRSDADGRRVSVPYRYDLNTDDRVIDAVSQWIDKHGGHLPSASWVIVSTGSASWLAVPLVGRAVVSDDDRATLVAVAERWRGVTL